MDNTTHADGGPQDSEQRHSKILIIGAGKSQSSAIFEISWLTIPRMYWSWYSSRTYQGVALLSFDEVSES